MSEGAATESSREGDGAGVGTDAGAGAGTGADAGATTGAAPRAAVPRRVLLLGATGTIGRATAHALVARGHELVCFVRRRARAGVSADELARSFPGATLRYGDVTDAQSLARDGFRGERFDVVVSCLASRTGVAQDAWAIDHQANMNALAAAKSAGVSQFVLLSAICVQKPRLAFQQAKLVFEKQLLESGLTFSIVRPTAFFKSLSGQVERVRRGKPFLVFGDGRLTACKPISDDDLADFISGCLDDASRQNKILPIGGPGRAQTPREQGEQLFALVGKPAKFKSVPVGMMEAIVAVLGVLSRVWPAAAAKAELARIGLYYATESMLVWDAAHGRYDADATPSHGSETLVDYQARLVRGEITLERGEQAVF
jgi:divinyl chlorophyllide a 8-vinyl-reductase